MAKTKRTGMSLESLFSSGKLESTGTDIDVVAKALGLKEGDWSPDQAGIGGAENSGFVSASFSDKFREKTKGYTWDLEDLGKGMRQRTFRNPEGKVVYKGKPWYHETNELKAMAPGIAMLATFIPGMQGFAGSIGSALGASGAAANALGGAVIGGTTSKLTGGDFLKGAIGGAIGGIPSAGSAIGRAMGLTGNAAKIVGSGVVNAGTSAAMGARGGDILRAGLGGSAGAGIGSFGASQGWNPAATQGLSRLGSSLVRGVPANQALVSALLRTLAPGKS